METRIQAARSRANRANNVLLGSAAALVYVAVRPSNPRAATARTWLEIAIVAAWATGLGLAALALSNPNEDDIYYVHSSSWIAAHGRFPVADVLFSNQRFPDLYWPPIDAYEAIVGTIARAVSPLGTRRRWVLRS